MTSSIEHEKILRAAGWLMLGVSAGLCLDLCAKQLLETYSLNQFVLLRSMIAIAIMLAIAPRFGGFDAFKTNKIGWHVVRSVFAIGAMFGGFAGSFFATKQGFISPESFVFLESAIILAIVVLGGMGSQIGIAIAAILLIGGLEYLRDVGFLSVLFGEGFDPKQWRMVIFGALMVAVMVWRPRGLIGNRTPAVVLKEHKSISADLVQEGHG